MDKDEARTHKPISCWKDAITSLDDVRGILRQHGWEQDDITCIIDNAKKTFENTCFCQQRKRFEDDLFVLIRREELKYMEENPERLKEYRDVWGDGEKSKEGYLLDALHDKIDDLLASSKVEAKKTEHLRERVEYLLERFEDLPKMPEPQNVPEKSAMSFAFREGAQEFSPTGYSPLPEYLTSFLWTQVAHQMQVAGFNRCEVSGKKIHFTKAPIPLEFSRPEDEASEYLRVRAVRTVKEVIAGLGCEQTWFESAVTFDFEDLNPSEAEPPTISPEAEKAYREYQAKAKEDGEKAMLPSQLRVVPSHPVPNVAPSLVNELAQTGVGIPLHDPLPDVGIPPVPPANDGEGASNTEAEPEAEKE